MLLNKNNFFFFSFLFWHFYFIGTVKIDRKVEGERGRHATKGRLDSNLGRQPLGIWLPSHPTELNWHLQYIHSTLFGV